MRFMKSTALALALAVAAPIATPVASPLAATEAEAGPRKVVKKRVVHRGGKRFVNKKVVIRRHGVRYVGGRYYYGGRYYDHDSALALGLIGFTFGAVLGGALAY